MLHALGLTQDQLQSLFPRADEGERFGIFACKWGHNAETVKLSVRRDLAGNRVSEALIRRQREVYYQAPPAPAPAEPAPRQRPPRE